MRNIIYFVLVAAIISLGLYMIGSEDEPALPVSSGFLEQYSVPTTIKTWGNQSYCMNLENMTQRDLCLLDAAFSLKDRNICSDIHYENLLYRCRAKVESNPKLCDKIDVLSEKDLCLFEIAFRINNMTYCNDIFARGLKDRCLYGFVMDKKPDPAVCFDIANESLRDKCIFYHVGLTTNAGKPLISPTLCYLIVDVDLERRCNETYLMGG
ncbi:MAG: hypothetical protein KKD39_00275 [Candidatus Altiarchaeota archaeon]|nr:hypothetical protein [Candidatus Altiarchaeota archaeon]